MTIRDERKGRNRLVLRKLAAPRKLWSNGPLCSHELEYLWYNADGGVQGSEFSYWSKRDVDQMLKADSLFDVTLLC